MGGRPARARGPPGRGCVSSAARRGGCGGWRVGEGVGVGLGGVVNALLQGRAFGCGPATAGPVLVGVGARGLFPLMEARSPNPMVPVEPFRSRQFSGANATTFAVYGALGTA